MIKAVLFDLGGTLHVCSNSEDRKLWFAGRLISRLGEYGVSLDISPQALARQLEANAERYKHEAEATMRELPPVEVWNDYYLREQHLGRETLEPIAEELSFLYDYERVCNLRRPHLISCMQALKSDGLRLGVISNILARSIVPHFMAEYGLDGYMECVLTSAGTGIRKPDAGIFRLAEAQMGLSPEELAYVGDTLSRDVRGVRNAGWRLAIQIYSPNAARRDKGLAEMGYKPDYSITGLMEIPGIIHTVNEEG
ncbi:MAG: HAD family hydrolase, partial [Clostridia bacterium]|nr:HAD family hydrolase [Clostridia bacterium]